MPRMAHFSARICFSDCSVLKVWSEGFLRRAEIRTFDDMLRLPSIRIRLSLLGDGLLASHRGPAILTGVSPDTFWTPTCLPAYAAGSGNHVVE
jgi:hypothetical protein